MSRREKFDTLIRMVLASNLDNEEKKQMIEFVNELEEPQDWRVGVRNE